MFCLNRNAPGSHSVNSHDSSGRPEKRNSQDRFSFKRENMQAGHEFKSRKNDRKTWYYNSLDRLLENQ